MTEGTFPIPASLHDLEREPYNLLPYPHDFDDEDEAARAESFSRLVETVDRGNRMLVSEGISLFQRQQYEGEDPWMGEERIQALYTLVRYVMTWSQKCDFQHQHQHKQNVLTVLQIL